MRKDIILLCLLAALVFIPSFGSGEITGEYGEETGAILQGNIVRFSFGRVSGIKVSIGELSTTTDENGYFIIYNIPLGDQIVTFENPNNPKIAMYSLKDVETNEAFTLGEINIRRGIVKTVNKEQIAQETQFIITTEHTGTWIGTMTISDPDAPASTVTFGFTIISNGNYFDFTMSNEWGDVWHVVGTENGYSVEGTATVISEECTGDVGYFSGTFSEDTASGTYESPPGTCNPNPGAGVWNVTKVL